MVTEMSVGNGVLAYSFHDVNGNQTATIEYYRGKDVSVEIPECIDGHLVTAIAKKAFLSAKTLARIVVPSSVSKIGDWAFASCNRLTELVLPKRVLEIGSGVFRDCICLEKIVLTDAESSEHENVSASEDIFYLLAATVSKLDAAYLLDVVNAGSRDWLEHFDSTVMQMLAKDDSDGFSKMLLCGEEDYVGDDSNFDTYCLMRRKSKVRMILLRLLHEVGLSEENRKALAAYLKSNMETATWQVVIAEHGEEREYFDLLINYDCINKENIASLIESMGEHNTSMKGYLMKVKNEQMGGSGFMDELDL